MNGCPAFAQALDCYDNRYGAVEVAAGYGCHTWAMASERAPRRRDPERKARILVAAAELANRRSFHTIGMADIGAEAGIVGSGIYRHFPSKTAILVALLDQVMNRLQDGAAAVSGLAMDEQSTLSELVRDHIVVAIEDRAVLAVYHQEIHTLPDDDRRRLRRAQRLYLDNWAHALAPLRTELTEAELRVAVHAAVGAIQSTLFFHAGLPDAHLARLLDTIAHGCLGVAPVNNQLGAQSALDERTPANGSGH